MEITGLGIDLAKNVLQLHGVDAQGNVVGHKKRTRPKLLPLVAQPQCGHFSSDSRQPRKPIIIKDLKNALS